MDTLFVLLESSLVLKSDLGLKSGHLALPDSGSAYPLEPFLRKIMLQWSRLDPSAFTPTIPRQRKVIAYLKNYITTFDTSS